MKKTQHKTFSIKNENLKNNINLPIIESSTKRNQLKINTKLYNKNKNLENSTLSFLSQSSIKTKSMSNITFEEKQKPKNTTQKIDDIINNVNKNHNINSKVNIKDRNTLENEIISKEKEIVNNNNNKKKLTNIHSITNLKNNTIKPKYKYISPKRMNVKINIDSPPKIEEKKSPRITKEKLKEIQERRKKRLLQEQKEYEFTKKILEDKIKNKNLNEKTEVTYSNKLYSPIQISHKKAQHILEEWGMFDAYKYLIEHLCKNGLPSGNLYEYSSGIIKNYEKEWKKKKSKLLNEKIEKYFENKKKIFLDENNINSNLNKSNDNLMYKVLKRREQEKFIKKLDKSRSTLNIIKRIPEIPDTINKIEKKSEQQNNKENINKSSNKNNSNIKNNNEKKIIIVNNELKKKNENNALIDENKKYIKQSFDEKKVYFNIKIKNNIEEIKEIKGNNENEKGKEINQNNNEYKEKGTKEEKLNKKNRKDNKNNLKLKSSSNVKKNINSSKNINEKSKKIN